MVTLEPNNIKQPIILIVDDEEVLRWALSIFFEDKGFKVALASSGRAAIEYLTNNAVDVVLTDIRMPDGDGLQLLKSIRQRDWQSPPVILITAFADITVDEAYDEGAEALFTKPFDLNALYEGIQLALTDPEKRWGLPPSAPIGPTATFSIQIAQLEDGIERGLVSIGRGGISVWFEKEVSKVESFIALKVAVKSGPGIEGLGIVRWVRSMGPQERRQRVGISFLYLSDACRMPLIDFIANSQPKSFIPRR